MIFINYKTYEEGTGQRAVALTKLLEAVAHESQVKVIPVVQATDIKDVVASTTLEVWSQKIDPFELGAHTGAIVAEAVLEDGASGTFLNHSESKFSSFDDLAKASDRAKAVGLKTLIFAANIEELKNVCSLNPSFVAYEPPELIGSSEISVAQAQPEIIKSASGVASAAGTPLIVGAGVHSMDDVKKCLELGAVGVAVASDVMKSENPEKELADLVEGFK